MHRFTEKEINTVYRTHVRYLFSYALGLGFDRETSMDAIHDVFYRICQDTGLLDNVGNVRFYLLRSLKNRLLDIQKQKRQTVEVLLDGGLMSELPFSTGITIEEQLIENEDDERIRRKIEDMLLTLTDRQREIIYLRYSQNFEYDEIAQMMKITIPTCRKLFHKAITKLRNFTLPGISKS